MAVRIERCDNGFVVSGGQGDEEAGTSVFQDSEEGGPAAALHGALWSVVDRLDMHGSRYDALRVRVALEPGDKYVAPGAAPAGKKKKKEKR